MSLKDDNDPSLEILDDLPDSDFELNFVNKFAEEDFEVNLFFQKLSSIPKSSKEAFIKGFHHYTFILKYSLEFS